MRTRAVIHVVKGNLACSVMLAMFVAPAWGQQFEQGSSSRMSYQAKIPVAESSAFMNSDPATKAVNVLASNSADPGPTVPKTQPTSRRPGLNPEPAPAKTARLDATERPPLKVPQLENPEQFKVSRDAWIKLNDENVDETFIPTTHIYKHQSPTIASQPNQSPTTVMRDKLQSANLRAGILSDSMQKAVSNRSSDLPNFNQEFVATAQLGPEYASPYQSVVKTWRTPDMRYRPLYFEDANLERYGNGREYFQPVASGLKFFASIAFLPYKMGEQSPHDCEYGMGYFRPGDCNPAYRNSRKFSPKGALLEGLVIGGLWAGL